MENSIDSLIHGLKNMGISSQKEEEYPYTYTATIFKKQIQGRSLPTKLYFKETPSRCFWLSEEAGMLPDIEEGTRVTISYKIVLVKTYKHFLIGRIQTESQKEIPSGLRFRISPSKNVDDLYVKCTNLKCNMDISLSEFRQCGGKILDDFTCCKCFSTDGFIGIDCTRETAYCKYCKMLQKL